MTWDNGGKFMVINGTYANTFSAKFANLSKQVRTSVISGKVLSRRFDTLELSDFFKKFSDENGSKSCITEIKKMLSKTESYENAERLSNGMTGYAYMEVSLVREAMRSETNIAKFNYYSEEKAYYQSLLNEADSHTTSGSMHKIAAYDDYEYICKGNETVDREKAMQALENVQNKINNLINDTQNNNGKTDMHTFNKCAASFTNAFGVENSNVVLSESNFNKLFGKVEATEEDYVQKYSEKAKGLWKCYDTLKECLSKSIDKIRSEINGEERVKAIKSAFAKAYGTSLADVMNLISELQSMEETE